MLMYVIYVSMFLVNTAFEPTSYLSFTSYLQLLLQLTRYNDESSSLESNSIIKMFKEVRELNPKCEDSYFYSGKYYDKILCSVLEQEKNDKKGLV